MGTTRGMCDHLHQHRTEALPGAPNRDSSPCSVDQLPGFALISVIWALMTAVPRGEDAFAVAFQTLHPYLIK